MGDTEQTSGTNRRSDRRTRRRRLVPLAVASTIALAACSGDDDDSASSEAAAEEPASEAPAADEPADADASEDRADSGDRAAANEPDVAAGGDGPAIDLGAIGRDVIIEMTVSMTSDDIEGTVAAITASTSRLGGGVASSDIDYGDPARPEQPTGRAWIVVKVPPESVDRLLAGLDEAGTVRAVNQSAEDVTEQLVDLDVRIRNARASVANVREFMDRTENLADLVTLESELTRRQTDLERLEAQQRNLSDRVALSTITIEIVPPAAIPEPDPLPADEGLGDALRSGWDAFARAAYGVVYIVLILLPFLLTGIMAAAAVWWITRRRRPSREVHSSSTPTVTHDDLPPERDADATADAETSTPVG